MNGRSGIAVIAVLVLLLIGLLVLLPMSGMWMWRPVMTGRGMMGGWGYPYGMGWGFMLVGMLIPLIFVILVVVGAYLWLTSRKEPPESDRAIAILNERYAKGEITKEQYLEMKENLTKK
jgi:putative membrane protein